MNTSETLQLGHFSDYLKPRPRDWHKGNAGHVLVIGGGLGYSGAPRMAAEAALRVGAGLVTVATHPSHAELLNLARPEIMCAGVKSGADLTEFFKKAKLIIVGPGLTITSWGRSLLKAVLKTSLPLVVDADALNILAQKPLARDNWILTPHPGEAGRLLGLTHEQVQADRLSAVRKLQTKYSGVCVLKGAGSLVSGDPVGVCKDGNPGMATAGMGDVLSGVIGGLAAQGIPLADAAKLGVCLHARAGDLAAKDGGERGMLAMDLMPYLRKLCNPN
ncbi:MAG: NAD(P)H-hydrate dehydratase [Gammaproteobacteria bacterium]|nr:NAD(P)H-hydrate dehydratase [Gammaproteobacteria bacterium]